MNIIRPWLYISNYRTSMSAAFIQKYQITHLLHLAENVQHPQVNTLYLPVEDGVPTPTQDIQRGVDFILKNYQPGNRILVACGAGMSRSATFAAAGLHLIEQTSLWKALTIVKVAHAPTQPTFKLWESFCQHYGEPFTHNKLIDIVHRSGNQI